MVEFAFGSVCLAFFIFTIWMWFDAGSSYGGSWEGSGQNKRRFFIAWYVGGVLSAGIVPMGMAVWYFRRIRPHVRSVPTVIVCSSCGQRAQYGKPCATCSAAAIRIVVRADAAAKSPEAVKTSVPSTTPERRTATAGAGWIPDPTSRHELRYWNGSVWTEHVTDATVTGIDPLPTTSEGRWEPDPTGRHQWRLWTGSNWSENVNDAGVVSIDPPLLSPRGGQSRE